MNIQRAFNATADLMGLVLFVVILGVFCYAVSEILFSLNFDKDNFILLLLSMMLLRSEIERISLKNIRK